MFPGREASQMADPWQPCGGIPHSMVDHQTCDATFQTCGAILQISVSIRAAELISTKGHCKAALHRRG